MKKMAAHRFNYYILAASLILSITALAFNFERFFEPAAAAAAQDDGKLRIIAFGAHPDDCELPCGGTGMLWTAKCHHVKFVSVTNGDIGHWREAGGPLAMRRKAEVEGAAKIFGTTVEVLDNHDGELMPTLENRRAIIRLIR